MPKISNLSGDQIIRILQKIGFEYYSSRGSHVKLKHLNSAIVIVPIHKGKIIPLGTLSSILRQAGITKQEFQELVKKYL